MSAPVPYPHTLEDLLVASMIDYPGLRGYCLRRLSLHDFKNGYNRLIFGALRDIDEPVDTYTVYRALVSDGMAAQGIAGHLADLCCLPRLMDREEENL